ncbi:MAG TPA: protein kinase [Candidatus Dormibacteraeota bacterium]
MPVTRFGRFTVQAELGRGAMGVVYKGAHPGLGVPVAIKVLAETFSKDASFRLRFQREAEAIAALNHPGIVRVYDFDEHEGSLFIVMEYVEGRSLRSYLHEYVRFNVDTSLDLIQQLLGAVGIAHQRWIVHRDLKPENVLVNAQGKTKILDFGVSKLVDDRVNLTATGSMVGTPYYMSPEQVRAEDVDRRADVYALGCMLYELLHGEPPFTGTMAAVLHSQVYDRPRASAAIPPALMNVIWQATEKSLEVRYQSCEEFAGALLALPHVADAPPDPPAPAEPPPSHSPAMKIRMPQLRLTKIGDDKSLAGAADGRKVRIGGCWHTGCAAKEGWACTYVDSMKRQCETWWCKEHVEWVEDRPFCPRHANSVRALAVTAGTIREIKHLPNVDDRALPLAALVAEDVTRDVTEVLRRRHEGRKDVRIAVDPTVRQHFLNRTELAWERSWAALKQTSYLNRVALRVTTAQPDTVQLVIDNGVVWSAVPDWITRHREGDRPDPADRARFRNQLIQVLLDRLDRQLSFDTSHPGVDGTRKTQAGGPPPDIAPALLEGMLLRLAAASTKLTGYELADGLALPFASVERAVDSLVTQEFLSALGISADRGPWNSRPIPERMAYAITNRGRLRSDEIGAAGTRYVGPAPVSLQEYQVVLSAATRTPPLDEQRVTAALQGIELVPGVAEAIRAAVNSRSSIFIYGAPGNGKTTLARRLVDLLGAPILVPYAIDLGGGDLMRVFDPSAHRPEGPQPPDRRWRLVARPLVQVGGEFQVEMLDPTWEGGSRTYEAPLQVKANGGVLLIDDLGRQKAKPKEILDRLILPLEQGVDFMNLLTSGRKIEVPFAAQLALSTNLKPGDLLDEAYIRRLSYKVHMPDPSWEMFERIFERERDRLNLPDNPAILPHLRALYGGRPVRGNHPRDLLERVTDVAAARGVKATLDPDLVESAWGSLFLAAT